MMDEYLVWIDGRAEDSGSHYSELFPRKAAEEYAADNYDGGWKSISVNVRELGGSRVYKFKITAETSLAVETLA